MFLKIIYGCKCEGGLGWVVWFIDPENSLDKKI